MEKNSHFTQFYRNNSDPKYVSDNRDTDIYEWKTRVATALKNIGPKKKSETVA